MKKIWHPVFLVVVIGLVFGVTRSMEAQALQNYAQTILDESSDDGYVCRVGPHFADGAASYGDFGFIWVSFMSSPNCAGSFLASGYIFSSGATTSLSHADYLYSEDGLIAEAEMLQDAAIKGQAVRFYRCSDEKTWCIRYIQFRGTTADVEVP